MVTTAAGEVLQTNWNGFTIFISFVIAVVGSYGCVVMLDHIRWRDTTKVPQPHGIMRFPYSAAALSLSLFCIWNMHFVAMSALHLSKHIDSVDYMVPMRFRYDLTICSAIVCVILTRCGIELAQHDAFAGKDRGQRLGAIVRQMTRNHTIQDVRSNSMKTKILMIAYFGQMQHLIGGSLLTALGVCCMHYMGMAAMCGEFTIAWQVGWIVFSVIIATIVSFAGFFILFRLLVWKASIAWLKPACAVVIAVAVTCMHYTGVVAAEYHYAPDEPLPRATFSVTANMQLALACISFAAALITERGIGGELRKAYAELFDVNLLEMLASGHTPGARSASRSQEGSHIEAGLGGCKSTTNKSSIAGSGHRSSFRMSNKGPAAIDTSSAASAAAGGSATVGSLTPPMASPASPSASETRKATTAEV